MISVAVLDDERIIRKGIVKIIRENIEEMEVIGDYSSAQQFLESTEDCRPQLLITDIRMPDISGLELVQILNSKKWDTDVIILSGYDDFDYCRRAIQFKVYDYLLKPLDKNEFIEILKRYCALKCDHKAESEGIAEHNTIREIKKYIRHNYQKNITLEQLGNRFFMNSNYISQLFKKETGVTISSFITDIRMEIACVLLNDCTKRVADIASEVGYQNSNQFSIVFKKKYGKTPSLYRREKGVIVDDREDE